jgi:hypothetical protein
MFKLAAVLLMLVVACNGLFGNLPGGYVDRPELIKDPTVQALIQYVSESLSQPENALKPLETLRVQTQVVNGMNYKIDFTGELAKGQTTICQVVINVRYDAVRSILQSSCQTS